MNEAVADPRRDWPWWLLLGVSLTTGAFLRIWQLGDQILIDDEWHALHKLLQSGMVGIATHFGGADYSIPLTLYYRALYDLGALSEWPIRLPLLVAGLALLLAPLAMRRLALPTRVVWTALLALSPVLIYLSRTARPYALNCLLVGFAVVAFERWWRGGSRAQRWAWGYAVATVLAAWLHLLTLAFTLLPFFWFGVPALWRWTRAGETRPVLRLLFLGLATLLPLLIFLLPPLIGDWHAMSSKAGLGQLDLASSWRTVLMAMGSAHVVLVLAELMLCGYGARRLWQRQPDWLAYLAFVAVAGLALIVLTQPNWIQHPGVLMRYVVPVLPLLLLLLAEGAAGILGKLRWPALGSALALALMAGVYFVGPLPFELYRPNQFTGDVRFQYSNDPLHTLLATGIKLNDIPRFYFQLAKLPPRSVTVAEGPWRLESQFNPLPWYQQLDKQYRRIAMITPVCGYRDWGEYQPDQEGIQLNQFVHLGDLMDGHDHGVDFLVLHIKPWTTMPPQLLRWPDMNQCLATVTAKLGPPIYRDARIAAFDLR